MCSNLKKNYRYKFLNSKEYHGAVCQTECHKLAFLALLQQPKFENVFKTLKIEINYKTKKEYTL